MGWFLDSSLRKALQSPRRVIERSGIREGMTALDLGCGSGAFVTGFARAVGEHGRVYALDMQEEMLHQLQRKLSRPEHADIKNIRLIAAKAYELPFRDASIDACFAVTALQEIPDGKRALGEIRRILKPGGLLAVTEFLVDPDYALRSTTIKLVTGAGFSIDGAAGNLWNYTVRFRKPRE
jgi:ubiquinone/menaquinone biosynthesis C-methylase UbiE